MKAALSATSVAQAKEPDLQNPGSETFATGALMKKAARCARIGPVGYHRA